MRSYFGLKRLSLPHQQANGGAYRSPHYVPEYTIYSSCFRQKKGNMFLLIQAMGMFFVQTF